jgi:hypothetical protein
MSDQVKPLFAAQLFEHKGEMIVVFSESIQMWSLPPETARELGEKLLAFANGDGVKGNVSIPLGVTRQ